MRRSSRILSFLLVLAALLGCDRTVTVLTTEKTDWDYVQEAWGGMKMEEPRLSELQVELPFTLNLRPATRSDSAICSCGMKGRIEGDRLWVHIRKCVCGPGAGGPMAVQVPRPSSGIYQVVYDDAEAGFPVLGQVEVQ